MRYIATRERVELIQDDRPPTRKQEQLIVKLVKDLPDARELDEYGDYQEHPTKANASAFISQALEENWSDVQKSDGYMKYIATRPRAERLGSHGLFGDKDGVELDKAMVELENYTGNVWTHIISLKREDAERLGYSYVVKLLVPRGKWIGKLLEYGAMKIVVTEKGKERFKAMHRSKLINQTDIAILSAYNAEIRGLYNYYSLANDAYKIGRFANIMKYSMYKTFANKYRTNVKRIKARYLKNGWFTVSYETKNGKREATYYKGGFKRKKEPSVFEDVATLPAYKKYDRKNSLRTRMKSGHCELCGSKTNSIELHQVKCLKDLTGKEPWETEMLKRRRKTLIVCPDCHGMIHAEDYLRRQ